VPYLIVIHVVLSEKRSPLYHFIWLRFENNRFTFSISPAFKWFSFLFAITKSKFHFLKYSLLYGGLHNNKKVCINSMSYWKTNIICTLRYFGGRNDYWRTRGQYWKYIFHYTFTFLFLIIFHCTFIFLNITLYVHIPVCYSIQFYVHIPVSYSIPFTFTFLFIIIFNLLSHSCLF
jgi:hypothetical protein